MPHQPREPVQVARLAQELHCERMTEGMSADPPPAHSRPLAQPLDCDIERVSGVRGAVAGEEDVPLLPMGATVLAKVAIQAYPRLPPQWHLTLLASLAENAYVAIEGVHLHVFQGDPAQLPRADTRRGEQSQHGLVAEDKLPGLFTERRLEHGLHLLAGEHLDHLLVNPGQRDPPDQVLGYLVGIVLADAPVEEYLDRLRVAVEGVGGERAAIAVAGRTQVGHVAADIGGSEGGQVDSLPRAPGRKVGQLLQIPALSRG